MQVISPHALVAKLVDALDLGSSPAMGTGSIPAERTMNNPL